MMRVAKDRVVSFRYVMRNSREEILEDTTNGMPTAYLHGTLAIQPLLQNQLEGMKAGGRKKLFLLKSSDLSVDDDFTFEIIIDEVREASQEELLLGYPVQVSYTRCEADCECYEESPEVGKSEGPEGGKSESFVSRK